MNETIQSPESPGVYPAVYDFSLLPYALGDVLTWNVKQCCQAKEAGCEALDIHVCADRDYPSNMHQNDVITRENWQLHLYELLPAFYTNPMVRNVHLYHDRFSFGERMRELSSMGGCVGHAIQEHLRQAEEVYHMMAADRMVVQSVSLHEDLNDYHQRHGSIPCLKAPNGCYREIESIRKELGSKRFLVLIHFRLRKRDQALGGSEPDRDANDDAWFEFITFARKKFKDALFIVLGKIHEKPFRFLSQDNVLVPRTLGYNLGHELAWFHHADLFLGSSSGFAAMANFTNIPYVITKISPKARRNYGIPEGVNRLPFAQQGQTLNGEEETVQLLIREFTAHYKLWKKKRDGGSEDKMLPSDLSSCAYYRPQERLKCELHQYILERMVDSRKAFERQDYEGSLAILNRLEVDYPVETMQTPSFHSARAICLYHQKRYLQARDAVWKELALNPLHPTTANIRQFLKSLEIQIKQQNVTCDPSTSGSSLP